MFGVEPELGNMTVLALEPELGNMTVLALEPELVLSIRNLKIQEPKRSVTKRSVTKSEPETIRLRRHSKMTLLEPMRNRYPEQRMKSTVQLKSQK